MDHFSLKLLLVEDNLLNQKLICLTLGKYGFNIDLAENGAKALSMIKDNHYDLILMDIMMPVMDGLETTRIIRESEKNSDKHTPIIGLAANTLDSDRQRCIANGMDEYLVKPFDVSEFLRILELLSIVK